MQDNRTALPKGTLLKLPATGSIFEISDEPLGFGGGGIIYPARRMLVQAGALRADGIYYALKECYPASDGQDYFRNETGEIIARDSDCRNSLEKAKARHFAEKERNQDIHVKAERMIPILEAADTVVLTLPGRAPVSVSNAVSVMESLENKGRSLSDCLAERRRFSARETCRILQQLLFALRDVHKAGYLHLDVQGGNVFLRGTLEDQSDFVTLIDFGSARPLLADGKTEEIRDREIFTSRGFSAAEILRSNTGTLRLDARADIYSVGCIGLYLLTGQRPNQSRLLANRSGTYLRSNELGRTDCPPHLREQLQELLAKALAKDPADRFGSADEMLEKVDKLLEALHPQKSALSAMTYDAFICYKHGPLDSPAAKALQQRLEHFHTTDNAGKRIRPFRKVFMDEGELAACADFGQQIHDALENSKWLLVICSEDTPLSPWVKLEIETFLKIHGPAARSRILTVLTSGEPEASLPPKLLEQETGGKEPFAADIRGEDLSQTLKKLKGDAFLRLAAAMLDRPFDALKQRQKVYFLQRLAALTAGFLLAAVAFAAYAMNRSNLIAAQAEQIQKEYETALINESLLLAEQAQKQLKANNPLEAMALARAALPSPEQDRPVVPEAELVLGKALGIYIGPAANKDKMAAVSTIDTNDNRFFLDDTGRFLFTWESYEPGLRLWQGENLSPVRELLSQEDIYYTSASLLLPEQNSLILRVSGGVISVNYLTGAENWRFQSYDILALCLSEDKTRVVLFSAQEGENGEKLQQLELLSAATGKSERQLSFRVDPGYDTEMSLILSPDLKWAAIPAANTANPSYIGNSWHALYLIDLESGSCRRLFDTDTEIITMKFIEDRLAVTRGSGYTFTTTHGNALYQYTEPIRTRIETYDPESGHLIWSSEHRYYVRGDNINVLEAVPYDTGATAGKGLLAVCADLCVLLDWDSGQVVREYELQSAALDIRCADNGFATVNADGSSSSASYDREQVVNIQRFADAISAVCRHQSSYYVQSTPIFSEDYSIRKYVQGKYDESYRVLFEEDILNWEYRDYRRTDKGIRLVLAKERQLCVRDSTDGSVLSWELPESAGFSPYQILGISPDAQRVYWRSDVWDDSAFWITDYALWVTELLTGESHPVFMPQKPEEYMTVMDTVFTGEAIVFTAQISYDTDSELGLFRWDLTQGTLEELYRHPLAPAKDPQNEEEKYYWEDYQYRSLQVQEDTGEVFFATITNRLETPRNLIRVNLSGDETARISPAFVPLRNEAASNQWMKYCYRWSPDGIKAVIGYGGNVYLTGPDGEEIFRIPAAGYEPMTLFHPDGKSLLVLTEDKVLSQYCTSDGTCLTSIDLKDYTDVSGLYRDQVQLLCVDEKTVILFDEQDGFLLDCSGEAVKIRAVVQHCIGYDGASDSILVAETNAYDSASASVGSFRRYSLEELLQKADAVLDQSP